MNITRLALFLATGLLVSAGLPLQAMAVTDHCAPDDSPPPNRIDPIMADVPSNQLDGDLVVGRDRHSERKLIQRVKMFRFQDKDVATVTTTKPIDFFPA